MISSLVFFVLGLGYSYFFHKNAQKTYEITIGVDESFIKEKIKYYYIWNSGKDTIYKEDLINESKCLEVSFDDDNFVEYAKISDKTSDYFKLDLHQHRNIVKIDFDLLRPDEGFTLMIKPKIISPSYWDLQIKQKKNVFVFPRVIKARGPDSNLYLFQNLLSYFGMGFMVFSAFFIQKIDFTNLESSSDYIEAITPLLYLGFIIFMFPTLLRRIRAPRPPIELELHYVQRNKEEKTLKNLVRNLNIKSWKRRKRR